MKTQKPHFKILIADGLSEAGYTDFKKAENWISTDEVNGAEDPHFYSLLSEAHVLLVRTKTSVNKEMLQQATKLLAIARAGNGLDHIDTSEANQRRITILHTPDESSDSAAEHTIGLLLMAARGSQEAYLRMRKGKWRQGGRLGFELHGKTAGIIGLGRIGSRVAKILKSFGMHVIANDPYIDSAAAEKIGVPLYEKNKVLQNSDIISLHTPLSEETKNIISKEELQLMKSGSILVNCARGGLVNEKALEQALLSEKLYAAAFDVFETEPLPQNHSLLKFPNFIASPHLGARTQEAQQKIDESIAKKIIHFLESKREL